MKISDFSNEKVRCETPTPGKKPTNIDRWKYEVIRAAIISVLSAHEEGVFFKDLPALVEEALDSESKAELGSVRWYTTTVKLDLEVKGEIKRVVGNSPQRIVPSGTSKKVVAC